MQRLWTTCSSASYETFDIKKNQKARLAFTNEHVVWTLFNKLSPANFYYDTFLPGNIPTGNFNRTLKATFYNYINRSSYIFIHWNILPSLICYKLWHSQSSKSIKKTQENIDNLVPNFIVNGIYHQSQIKKIQRIN